jgi:hypothetical protein
LRGRSDVRGHGQVRLCKALDCGSEIAERSKEASVLAHQGAQEGSGTCNFLSNGYCSQVLCMWTGVVELGAGMCHDEVAYRHLSFASCRCFSVIFHSHAKYTQCFCAVATAAAEVFTTLLCSHVPNIMLASHRVNLRALTSRSGELSASKGPLVAQNSTQRNGNMHSRGLWDRAATGHKTQCAIARRRVVRGKLNHHDPVKSNEHGRTPRIGVQRTLDSAESRMSTLVAPFHCF